MCTPKGRDCVEEKSALSFNCRTSCEGIYADSGQWAAGGEADVDKEEIISLISEYKNFKLKNVKHFRFSSNATSTIFGKFHISSRTKIKPHNHMNDIFL